MRKLLISIAASCCLVVSTVSAAPSAPKRPNRESDQARPTSVRQTAPDTLYRGSFETTAAEYRFAPSIDPTVLPDVITEIWAKVYRPLNLSDARPVIVLLHGNHETCEGTGTIQASIACAYTFTGQCPAGSRMVPSYLGFSYLAEHLASWGYFVISIKPTAA